MPTTPHDLAQILADALASRGLRTEVAPADPPYALTAATNVWATHSDRYPADTIWPPADADDQWQWGANFEHHATPETDIVVLVDLVIATTPTQD